MQGDGTGRASPADVPDGVLWQRSRMADAAEDETERFLDLAAFVDGRLDSDDRERIAEWLAGDPVAAGDAAAARALAATTAPVEAVAEAVVARACALIVAGAPQSGKVIAFPARPRYTPGLQGMARWSGLAAAMAVVGWLGFALGVDASLTVAHFGQAGDDGFLQELSDPSTGFLRDFSDGAQT
jgi:anti-sigma factor RsiW